EGNWARGGGGWEAEGEKGGGRPHQDHRSYGPPEDQADNDQGSGPLDPERDPAAARAAPARAAAGPGDRTGGRLPPGRQRPGTARPAARADPPLPARLARAAPPTGPSEPG